MRSSIKLIFIMSAIALLAGCSSMSPTTKNVLCAVTGAAVGAGVGAAIDNSDTAAGGAVGGGILGLIVCPETKKAPVDSDGDGITDDMDKCPNTPIGAKVDATGCADTDNDGVTDNMDKCPNTPAGAKVDETGCPLENTTLLSLPNVKFDFDKATLTDEAKDTLNQAVSMMKGMNGSVAVKVEGNTDSSGPAAYNMKLSQARSESVVNYLVSQGVDASLLTAEGMGETNPVASNDTKEGRAENRRVDFVVK